MQVVVVGVDGEAVTPEMKAAQCQDTSRHELLKSSIQQLWDESSERRGSGADAFYLSGEAGGEYNLEPFTKAWKYGCIELEAGDFHKAVGDTV